MHDPSLWHELDPVCLFDRKHCRLALTAGNVRWQDRRKGLATLPRTIDGVQKWGNNLSKKTGDARGGIALWEVAPIWVGRRGRIQTSRFSKLESLHVSSGNRSGLSKP